MSALTASITDLAERFRTVRRWTEQLCAPLAIEDQVVQSMPDVSPTRWHLAHTTWFFETFLLAELETDYHSPFEQFDYLFNSYYNTVGDQFPRAQRGLLTRPTVAEVMAYRAAIDQRVMEALQPSGNLSSSLQRIVEIGLQHEQQHQELIVTDIKHVLSRNPLYPAYHQEDCPWIDEARESASQLDEIKVVLTSSHDGGIVPIGAPNQGFAFDNEHPRHQALLQPFHLSNRLVTNGEYLKFINDGGYRRPELWLSMGWSTVQERGWQHPLYWKEQSDGWQEFTLWGLQPLDWNAPVCHVSYFEADAFARWSGSRLPTEFEWEAIASDREVEGHFAESLCLHPRRAVDDLTMRQLFGDVWEWTASPYLGYPGYVAPQGAIGEYNGKFMCNQFVLRGGSCATPQNHIRATYRNFFPPDARWQFSGIRLAHSA